MMFLSVFCLGWCCTEDEWWKKEPYL